MTPCQRPSTQASARKRIYLHIGTAKTGSSFLQTAMATHWDAFCDEGIYYPQAGRHPLFKDEGHHLLPIALMQDRWQELELELPEDRITSVWQELEDEIATIEQDEVFLSSEWFAFDVCGPDQIARLKLALSTFDVTVVIVLRDIVDFINSTYSQRVRDGFEGTVVDYIKLSWPHLNWLKLTERWIAAFGYHNVIPISYEYLRDRDYIGDFSHIVFGRDIAVARELGSKSFYRNQSLSLNATHAIFEINRSDISSKEKEQIRDQLKELYDKAGVRYHPSFISSQLSDVLRFTCEWPEVRML